MTTVTATTTQVYRVFIRATPEAIWDAITKPEWSERYGYGGRVEYDLRPGGAYRVFASDDMKRARAEMGGAPTPDVIVDGEVVESDPPRKLVHGWRAKWNPELAAEEQSRVTWEIEPRGDGVTLLTLVHDRLEGAPKTAAGVSGEGWMRVISGLKTFVETGKPLA